MIAPGHLDYLDQPPSNWFCPRRDAMQSAEVGLVRTEIKEQIEGVRCGVPPSIQLMRLLTSTRAIFPMLS
jgi:hypothetical protein